MSHRKRHADEGSYRSDLGKRPYAASPTAVSGGPADGKGPKFPSYLDAPDLSPKIRLLCEILATAPPSAVAASLEDAGVRITTDDVEEVLKLSYSHPSAAVKFFRWAGGRLNHHHSPYAWNLVVDLLGKNLLFDAMWDAVGSMRTERLLSLATFASIFSSFAAAGRSDDAFAAFDTMESLHGVPRDAPALNTLLSALCREGRTSAAHNFLVRVRHSIPPDADTYAILLEGCENEGHGRGADSIFFEMVAHVGWDPANVPAYDSYLITLIQGSSAGLGEALKFLNTLKEHRCFPGMKFFRRALQELVKVTDSRGACTLWDALAGRNGCYPDTPMYNSMIALQCYGNRAEMAELLLDEMVMYGAFPDSQTYNVMLQFLLKDRKYRDSVTVFNEMVKNEFCPTVVNCTSAMKIFLDSGDWEMGIKVWKCMAANNLSPLEECANMLVLMLRDLDRLPEACKYAEDVIDRGIKLHSSTLSKLKTSLLKVGKTTLYNQILMKWKGIRN